MYVQNLNKPSNIRTLTGSTHVSRQPRTSHHGHTHGKHSKSASSRTQNEREEEDEHAGKSQHIRQVKNTMKKQIETENRLRRQKEKADLKNFLNNDEDREEFEESTRKIIDLNNDDDDEELKESRRLRRQHKRRVKE